MGKIYLFYGEEKYDRNQRIEKIKKEYSHLEIGANLYYLNKENIEELDNILQGVSFFGTEKLIIIKDTKLKFNINLILDQLDEDVQIILLEETVDKRTSEYKAIAKVAECVEFKHMDSQQMTTYLMQMLKKYGLEITQETAEYMQMLCGEDKTNNINELQKLVIYLNKGDTVTKEIIDKVCSKTLNAKIFDVLNKIVNKDKKQAIQELNELLEQKEPIVKIYIMLYKQIKQMYCIKYLKTQNIENIATELGIHPFVFKNLSKSSQKYSLDELKAIINEFDYYDEKTKLGEMDFEIGLKKIIASM